MFFFGLIAIVGHGNFEQGGRTAAGIDLRWCPPGSFRMGSPPEEEQRRADEQPVEVQITHGFWMGKYEVTQGEWKRLVGPFPRPQPTGEGPDFPLVWVNYEEAHRFCRALTALARRKGELPSGYEFQLPTEAQWEYAARAGTTTTFAFGPGLNRTQANFKGAPYRSANTGPSLGRAEKVGRYRPNAWGLYDMHGSVFEWCRDWYHSRLPGGRDPDLSATKGAVNRDGTYSRVRRGGAWDDDAEACRSAYRLRYEPDRRADHIGFRVVLTRTETNR